MESTTAPSRRMIVSREYSSTSARKRPSGDHAIASTLPAGSSTHVALGEADAAFTWLERALEERDFRLVWAHTDAALDPLRKDAQFHPFIDRVGVVRRG
jgi:hypothetical protein